MITEIKISDLFVLSNDKGEVYPKIFISSSEAEEYAKDLGDLKIINKCFINN